MSWRERLDKATVFLRTAEEAGRNGDWDSATSRSYYAAFHSGVAFLEQHPSQRRKRPGQEWKEREVKASLAEHFRAKVRGAQRLHSLFQGLLEERVVADYHAGTIGRKRGQKSIQDARVLVEAITNELKRLGQWE